VVNVREREDVPNLPEPVVASTGDPLRLNATLPRTNGWASDTANLTRQIEHLRYRRLTGLRLGQLGGTYEYAAQFPRLPDANPLFTLIHQHISSQCMAEAAHFTSVPFNPWLSMVRHRQLLGFNHFRLNSHWQLRLLTTNLTSFCVWTHDSVGGAGNHSQWQGATLISAGADVRELELSDLFPADPGPSDPDTAHEWGLKLRERGVAKLKAIGAPEPDSALRKNVSLSDFTLSPTGLQL
jgi:hypothetical protein